MMTGSIDHPSSEPPCNEMEDWEVLETENEEDTVVVLKEETESDNIVVNAAIEAGEKDGSLKEWMRKTSVAVVGGTMIGVGLVMIPLPTPCGALVAGSGMAVLGTEFPAAQRVLDRTCNTVADAIEDSLSRHEETEEEPKQEAIHSNETMKAMMLENQRKKDGTFKNQVREIAKKAAPAIRKIGHGIDREQLEKASNGIAKAATDARDALGAHASRLWRSIMVLDDDEALLAPFQGQATSS